MGKDLGFGVVLCDRLPTNGRRISDCFEFKVRRGPAIECTSLLEVILNEIEGRWISLFGIEPYILSVVPALVVVLALKELYVLKRKDCKCT